MATTGYVHEAIDVLPGLEAVRRRPGMFVGDIEDGSGMHHMLFEVIGNAIDEHLGGTASYVRVAFDGARVTVDDDGRGIPIEALETVLTRLHAGTATGRPHVHLPSTLRGIGLAPVCALSSELIAETWRDGSEYVQTFSRGESLGPAQRVGPATRTGTRITFTPDFTILTPVVWDRKLVAQRGRELAAINARLTTIVDGVAFRCPDGLVDLVRADGGPTEVFHIRGTHDGASIDAAFGWTECGAVQIDGFVNCARADGVHVAGLFRGLRRAFTRRMPQLVGVRTTVFRRRIERGMHAAIAVMLDDPRYGNPTHDWLTNPEIGAAVSAVVTGGLVARMEEDPAFLDTFMSRFDARLAGSLAAPTSEST